MAFTLNKTPKVRYSPTEQKLFGVLTRYAGRKKLPTTQLIVWDMYGDLPELPFHAYQATNVTIRSLGKKLEINGEPFRLKKVKVPGKKIVWDLEPAKKKVAA